MSNIVTNPGFELGDQDWTKLGTGAIVNSAGRTGAWRGDCEQVPGGSPGGGGFRQPLSLVAGLRYRDAHCYVRLIERPDPAEVTIQLLFDDGVIPHFASIGSNSITLNEWTKLTIPSRIAATSSGTVQVLAIAMSPPFPVLDPGEAYRWQVDDFLIDDYLPDPSDVAEYRKWEVLQRLRQKLTFINGTGSGYRTELNDRVFYTQILPSEDTSQIEAGSYVCMPLDGQIQTPIEVEGRHMRVRWKQLIYGYVPNRDASLADTVGRLTMETADLEDDMTRALFSGPNMAGLVKDSTIIDSQTFAGEDPELLYGEVHLTIQFDAYIDLNNIGPIG